jgi:transcriptional regulator with XRE-family HTH domain
VNELGWDDPTTGGKLTITRDAIAKNENGERAPKPITLRALCEALTTEDEVVTPRDMLPNGTPMSPHADAAAKAARRDHNAAMREFAEERGIEYRHPVTGRIYYSKELRERYAEWAGSQQPVLLAG